jgi:predicted TIM-barrel fold metal-dependent hydrolase
MNIPVREVRAAQTLSFIDGDIHPAFRQVSDLYPFLPARWREHLQTYGEHLRQGLTGQLAYPRMMASGMRADAFPEQGPPGSDLELMRKQHLDANGVEIGNLVALSRGGMEERNLDFAAALSQGVNDWQIENWVKPEPRLRAGIVVPQEDAAFAASEIERRASDRRFVQVIFSPRATDPIGHRRYWPIYEAAERNNLPLGLHSAGFSGGHPSTPSGWPTYYMQEQYSFFTAMQSVVTSLIFEGVFDRYPKLKVVLIEGGFSWAPALGWRMDKHWERMRSEIPHVKRRPSEYLRGNFWFTTQPIEEPEKPEHLSEIIDWLGWDRLIFSSDYPHWDFDHPRHVFKFHLTDAQKSMVFRENARAVYGLQ